MLNNKVLSIFCISFCLILLCPSCADKNSEDQLQLKVLQLNLWQEGTMIPNGLESIVEIIEQISPDVALFCEIRNYNEDQFMPKLLNALNEKGLHYFGESLDMSVGILSKYKIENPQSVVTLDDQSRPMMKGTISVGGQDLIFYSAHLDYTHYECYLPRGYSGTTWEKLEAPVTDVEYILEANRLSYRDEAITAFIEDANAEIEQGNIVILGGDFNEPSHLDWQDNTKYLWCHNGVVIDWDCSVMLDKAGYVDCYREIYSNAVEYPGFTFPSGNRHVEVSKLSWAPQVDERDRIDFIYYFPFENVKLTDIKIVGPSESVYYGEIRSHDAKDEFIEPNDVWPTDHKGNLALFTIKPIKNKN